MFPYLCAMKLLRLILVLLPTLLAAQSDSMRLLPNIEITSQRINRFTVGQMRMEFDSATLSIYKNSNLSDFLQNNTPLSIKAYGTGLATVSSRGTGSSHTAVIWNGFNIQNSLNGLVDLPLNEAGAFEHVGVKFGGGSALYGSSAIGGAIYLDNDIRQKRGFHGELGFLSGSFGLFGENLSISTGNDKVVAAFRLSHQVSDNEFLYKNTAEIGQPLKRAQNAAFEKLNLTGNFFFNIHKNHFFKINVWESRNDRQISPTMTAQNDKARLQDANSRIAAEWSYFKGKSVTKARLAYFDEDNLYTSATIDSSRNRAKTTISEVEHNIDFSEKNHLRVGLNVTHNQALTKNFDSHENRSRFALFGAYNFTVLKTDLSLAVRQEWVDNGLVPFTCSLGFNKALTPFSPKKLIIRGSFSKNYNLPALNDLYWARLGNPNLKAENGLSSEVGVDALIKHGILHSKIGLTGFVMQTKNWIQWAPKSDGLWHPSNLNEVFSRGFEALYQLNYAQKEVKSHLNIHYQYARATDLKGKQLLYTPTHSGNIALFLNYKKHYFQYNQTASSRRFSTVENNLWTKGFTVGNATIGTVFKIKKIDIDVSLKALNLYNADYQIIAYYANPRRQFVTHLRLKF